jgi:phenylacetate-CoA ligase
MLEPAVEAMGRDALRAEQERLLRAQIERCAASSVLYRAKLESAGAKPGDVRTLDDLARLPVVTKEELRADQLQQPPFGTLRSPTAPRSERYIPRRARRARR